MAEDETASARAGHCYTPEAFQEAQALSSKLAVVAGEVKPDLDSPLAQRGPVGWVTSHHALQSPGFVLLVRVRASDWFLIPACDRDLGVACHGVTALHLVTVNVTLPIGLMGDDRWADAIGSRVRLSG